MNNIIVGMGEALLGCVARRKENRWCSGKLLPIMYHSLVLTVV